MSACQPVSPSATVRLRTPSLFLEMTHLQPWARTSYSVCITHVPKLAKLYAQVCCMKACEHAFGRRIVVHLITYSRPTGIRGKSERSSEYMRYNHTIKPPASRPETSTSKSDNNRCPTTLRPQALNPQHFTPHRTQRFSTSVLDAGTITVSGEDINVNARVGLIVDTYKRQMRPHGKHTMAVMIPHTPYFFVGSCWPAAHMFMTGTAMSRVNQQPRGRERSTHGVPGKLFPIRPSFTSLRGGW